MTWCDATCRFRHSASVSTQRQHVGYQDKNGPSGRVLELSRMTLKSHARLWIATPQNEHSLPFSL
jgi:hypothetical protein